MSGRSLLNGFVGIALLFSAARAESPAKLEPNLKAAVKANPNSFEANYRLGEFYLHAGQLGDGIPYMEKAQSLRPSDYASGYDLALAYFEIRDYAKARRQIRNMLDRKDAAEMHTLLADVEEAAGAFVSAADEYQRAARMDPSEERMFDWGTELLRHQTLEAASAVFTSGVQLHPQSAKIHAGLGIALYLRGNYAGAVESLCSATDLKSSESWPYLFLGKIYSPSLPHVEEVRNRLRRFAQLEPNNAHALYYYAVSLWTRDPDSQTNLPQVESLLKKAVALDSAYADAHLQLGILYEDRRKHPEAIAQFQRAIALQPNLTTAHYHLAQALMRTGERAGGQQELQVFERLRKQDQMETEKERNEIKQFVVEMKEPAPNSAAR